MGAAGAGGSAAGGGAAGAGGAGTATYAGQITCVDSNGPTVSSPLTLDEVESCVFHGPTTATPNTLTLTLRRAGMVAKDHLEAQIVGLTKAGSYPTGASDADTTVGIAAFNDTANTDGSHDAPGGTSAGAASCPGACTFSITDATVTTAPAGFARVAGSISCSKLAAAGIGCVSCTMAPAVIAFDVGSCIVD